MTSGFWFSRSGSLSVGDHTSVHRDTCAGVRVPGPRLDSGRERPFCFQGDCPCSSPQGQMSCFPFLLSCHLRSLEQPWEEGVTVMRGRSLLQGEAPRVSPLGRLWAPPRSWSSGDT